MEYPNSEDLPVNDYMVGFEINSAEEFDACCYEGYDPGFWPDLNFDQPDNSNTQDSSTAACEPKKEPGKKKKNMINLSNQAKYFKKSFYAILLGKFPKQHVQELHNKICNQLGLPPMSRAEKRSIDLYFEHFSPYGLQIVEAIKYYLTLHPEIIHQITHL